ncbi:hypothetical protein F4780DRAFT_503237 [Xylariomycetidae sp. FL0641]|nr:hypothetical protein F4780DRAFT_503237 [Xylariomycetidae sp. FL0641]
MLPMPPASILPGVCPGTMAASGSDETPACDDQLTITLSSRNQTRVPQRRLVLTRETPSIRIGRASKVSTKGYVAASDNAWFESPVMSRQHAEIFADFDDQPHAVFIKDASSLHGTFLTPNDGRNLEKKLDSSEKFKLGNGDIIRFGIDIFRTKEAFPPCAVDFRIEPQHSETPSRTFTVPDDIDEEEEEEVQVFPTSGAIDLTADAPSPEDPILPSSCTVQPPAGSARVDLIDLTSEPNMDSDLERNTSPVPASSPARAPSPQMSSQPHQSAAMEYREGAYRLAESDAYESEEDEETDPLSIEDGGIFASDSSDADPSDISDSGMESSENDVDDARLQPENSTLSDMDEMDEMNEDDDMEDEEYPTSDVDSMASSSDDASGEDEDDTGSLADASSAHVPSEACPPPPENTMHRGDMNFGLLFPSGPLPVPRPDVIHPSVNYLCQQPATQPSPVNLPPATMAPREPSPSDAAMFKRQPLGRPPSHTIAHALGVKTGKYEYFIARENNRATVSNHEASSSTSAIRETLNGNSSQRTDDLESVAEATVGSDRDRAANESLLEASAPIMLDDSMNTEQLWWSIDDNKFSGDRFINRPCVEDLPKFFERPKSPELDMTSAYTFVKAKGHLESLGHWPVPQSDRGSDTDTSRETRRLPIQDLLAQEPRSQPSPPPLESSSHEELKLAPFCGTNPSVGSKKRTYTDAFDASSDAVDTEGVAMNGDGVVATTADSQAPGTSSVEVSQTTKTTAIAEGSEPMSLPVQVNTSPMLDPSARPSKRLRLAQVAACFALGSAATFSYLVNTAPVF